MLRKSTDTGFLAARVATIETGMWPRSWTAVAAQINSELAGLLTDAPPVYPPHPTLTFGSYYPTGRSTEIRTWPGLGTGEIFRVGKGWDWPLDDVC